MKRMAFILTLVMVGSLMTGSVTKSKTREVPPQVSSSTMPASAEAVNEVVLVPGVAGGMESVSMEISAVVTAIDHEKRTATLKGPEGNFTTINVGPEAVNFDQVVVGDIVNVEIIQEVTAFVTDAGSSAGDELVVAAERAAKGEQPGGAVVGSLQLVATIVDLDVWSRRVELQFEDGTVRTHSVRPDVIMEGYEVGDKVVIQFTKMVAISIEKP